MKRSFAHLLPAFALALAAAPMLAQQPVRPAPPAERRMAPAMRAGAGPFAGRADPAARLLALRTPLALTDAQVARLQQLATAQTRTLQPPTPALLRARADFLDAMRKDDLDAAHAAMERMARVRTDAAFARLQAAKDARDVLTADQKAKLQQFGAERRARLRGLARQRRGFPGGMRGRPGGMGSAPRMGAPGAGMPAMPGMPGMPGMRGTGRPVVPPPGSPPDSL